MLADMRHTSAPEPDVNQRNLNYFLKNHLPWITWSIFIIVLISIPGKDLPVVSKPVEHFQPDKWVHVFLFLVFIILLLMGFDRDSFDIKARQNLYFYSLITGILFSGGTEIFQHYFILGRTMSLKDFLYNFFGCVFGWTGYFLWRNRIDNK